MIMTKIAAVQPSPIAPAQCHDNKSRSTMQIVLITKEKVTLVELNCDTKARLINENEFEAK
jgi:hypothetical protein